MTESLMEMSPQEQNRLQTATANVGDRGAALATKTQLCLKPIRIAN
ncbi:hypothetical protein [Microcoleus sp. Pol11C3]